MLSFLSLLCWVGGRGFPSKLRELNERDQCEIFVRPYMTTVILKYYGVDNDHIFV